LPRFSTFASNREKGANESNAWAWHPLGSQLHSGDCSRHRFVSALFNGHERAEEKHGDRC